MTTLIYGESLVVDLYQDFESLAARSRRIRPRQFSAHSCTQELAMGLARLASPLL